MWRSKDDFLRDLAYLNDFDASEDLEPFKVFYSNGKSSKIKKSKKLTEKFTDSRTGEVIDVDNIVLNLDEEKHKGKGRGKLLSGFSSSKFQLEKQLRLAKPMGSNDEAIVSYFSRNRKADNVAESSSHSRFCNGSQILPVEKSQPRLTIKATRTSSKNALINALLSKSEESGEVEKFDKDTPGHSWVEYNKQK